jgi:hypothetical protein
MTMDCRNMKPAIVIILQSAPRIVSHVMEEVRGDVHEDE